ncbi:recombinase family protein [Cellulomonas cellasea]|uniref:recombinase family protein n=1 Tax=Cellulomonas cellasea TaxID=43670 RepID=UPI001B80A494|nr:recombinase family protein [Cellulomonas cellasea]
MPGRVEDPLELAWHWPCSEAALGWRWTVDAVRLASLRVRDILEEHRTPVRGHDRSGRERTSSAPKPWPRISTDHQNLEAQRDALTAAGCERIFTDTMSGASESRPGLAALLDYARAGDTVMVVALDRLERSLSGVIRTIETLTTAGVLLRSQREGIDYATPTGRMLAGIFGALAEYERELMHERAAAARAAARPGPAHRSASAPVPRPNPAGPLAALELREVECAGFERHVPDHLERLGCRPGHRRERRLWPMLHVTRSHPMRPHGGRSRGTSPRDGSCDRRRRAGIRPVSYRRTVITPSTPDSSEDTGLDAGLRTSRPPSRFSPVRRWVLDSVTELHGLREGLRQEINTRARAREDRLLDGIAHSLVLVASELATNAIRHGRPPTIVELLQHDTLFLLTVADHDLSNQPRIAGDRPPGEGGFGLQIARRLSVDVGWYRTNTVKVVWAEIGP